MPPNVSEEDTSTTIAVRTTPGRLVNQSVNSKPATPSRRASSAGPPSSYRSTRRTPANQSRTPGTQRIGSARRAVIVTPHGRAAQRELNLRRAGLTPRDRRRSGIQQRATPRDTLRQLSRLLAPISQRIVATPEANIVGNGKGKRTIQDDDLDDGPELPRPRFSLPMGDEDDEDDSLLEPPQSAGLENEDYTGNSIELPRRAISELPSGRYSRGSFGSVRMSDAFADLNDMQFGGNAYDSSYLADGGFKGYDDAMEDNIGLAGETTATLRGFDLGRGRLSVGRESDIRPAGLAADDTTTEFVFNVPQRELSEEEPDEPVADPLPELDFPDLDVEEIQNKVSILDNPNNVATEETEDEDVEEPEGLDPDETENFNSRANEDPDMSIQDPTMHDTTQELEASAAKKSNIKRKKVKVSKHGIQYPSLPAGVVKKLAMNFARTAGNSKSKINKETLDAIMQATDWFFEQVSEDLGAYANHAGRKTIDESDIVTLMARQRQTNATTTPFSLAQRYLPRELLQELRMVPPSKLKKGRPLESVEEDGEED